MVRRAILLALTAALLAPGPVVASASPLRATAAASPRLATAAGDGLTLRGSGFHAHEHVRLVVRVLTHAPIVRHVVASSRGAFTTSGFPAAGPCARVNATATGNGGSNAMLRGTMQPDCLVG